MEPGELRIGNYVMYDYKIGRVNAIDSNKVTIDKLSIKYCNIKPVLLTKAILCKCGFEKIQTFTVTESYLINLYNGKFLSIGDVDNANQMCWIHTMENGVIDDLVNVHNYDYDGYMSLHKLQNLYFLLSGKELEINF